MNDIMPNRRHQTDTRLVQARVGHTRRKSAA
jgi:hypothetical protein